MLAGRTGFSVGAAGSSNQIRVVVMENIMTIKYLKVPVGEHGAIKIEIEPTDDTGGFEELGIDESKFAAAAVGGFEDLGLREGVRKTTQAVTAEALYAFDKMSDTIHTLAYGLWERIEQLEEKAQPDEVSVELGLSLKADAGVVVAQVGTDANFKVKLTWKPSSRSRDGR